MNEFYRIPIDFDRLLQGQLLDRCNIRASIDQHIRLMILTSYREHAADRRFGWITSDFDFEILRDLDDYKKVLASSLKETIEAREKRLSKVEVTVSMGEEVNASGTLHMAAVKQSVIVDVNGTIARTEEPYYFQTVILISPTVLGSNT